MRWLVVLAFLGATCCAPYSSPRSPRALVQDLGNETVALIARDPDDGDALPFCSGVWVGPHTILTAGHCGARMNAEGLIAYIVRSEVSWARQYAEPSAIHWAKVTKLDSTHDLAALETTDAPAHLYAQL